MDNPNQILVNNNPSLVEDRLNQKIHYFNPAGRSNDIQSMVPHYTNGKVDYWDGYYLWDVKANGNNQWYHFKTNNFAQFNPTDLSNPISIKNVAIPDKWYSIGDSDSNDYFKNIQDEIEVDKTVNPQPLSWGFVATGSVLMNNTKAGGQPWFTVDQWGNKINPDAKIACFSTFGYGDATHLAYTNDDRQFHPITNTAEIDSTMADLALASDFRDGYLVSIKNGTKLAVYEAGGYASKIYALTSSDGFKWDYNPQETVNMNNIPDDRFHDRMIETPYVDTINGQPLMFFGVQSKQDRSISHVGYVTGYFNDNGIFQMDKNPKYGFVDDGFDNYAGNFTKLDDNRLIYVGWLGNWGYFNGSHNGGFTLARILTWDVNYGLKSVVIEPGETINYSSSNLTAQSAFNVDVGKRITMDFLDPSANFNITLTRTDNASNRITFGLANRAITVTRKGSGNGTSDLVDTLPLPNLSKISRVQIYLDNISVEIYLPEVQKVYTMFSIDNKDIPYQVISSVGGTVAINSYDQTKTPALKDFNNINNNFNAARRRWNGMKDTTNDGDRKQNLNDCFAVMTQTSSEISDGVSKLNQLGNDARSNVYTALINNGLDLISSRLLYTQRQSV